MKKFFKATVFGGLILFAAGANATMMLDGYSSSKSDFSSALFSQKSASTERQGHNYSVSYSGGYNLVIAWWMFENFMTKSDYGNVGVEDLPSNILAILDCWGISLDCIQAYLDELKNGDCDPVTPGTPPEQNVDVPEPGMLVLFALALAGLGFGYRRRLLAPNA